MALESRTLTMAQIREAAGVPATSRLVDIEYHSEPDGACSLFADDGDPHASLVVLFDQGPEDGDEGTPEGNSVAHEIAEILKRRGMSRISLRSLQINEDGTLDVRGLSLRVPGDPED